MEEHKPDAPPRPDADPGEEDWAPVAYRMQSRGTSGLASGEAGAVHGRGWSAAAGTMDMGSLQQYQIPDEPYQHATAETADEDRPATSICWPRERCPLG